MLKFWLISLKDCNCHYSKNQTDPEDIRGPTLFLPRIYPSMRPCFLWIQTLSISVAAFYPYHPRPSPTTALHDRTLLSPQAHFKHAAGGAHQGAPDVVKLHMKRQRVRVGHVPPIHYNLSD